MIAFDLDGTLFDRPPYAHVDYNDPRTIAAWVSPIRASCQFAAYLSWENPVAYVTGRVQSILEEVTLQQIYKTTPLPTPDRPDCTLIMQPDWRGYDKMVTFKRRALERLDAHLYVGDHAADRIAAERAGVPFMDAQAFYEDALARWPRLKP